MIKSIPPILCTGLPTWEGEYQKSTVQLMRAISMHHPVVYVEYPFTYKDVFQGYRDGKKPYKRIMGIEPRLRNLSMEGGKDLHVLTLPPILPVNGLSEGAGYDFLASLNASRSAATIRQTLASLGYTKPLLINAFNPFLGPFLNGKMEVWAEYYYCYDQIGAARWTSKHGPRLEQKYLDMVDGLITSSQALLDEKLREGRSGIVIKNGVNLSLFKQAYVQNPSKKNPTVLGYLGSIDNRLDINMLFHVLDGWENAVLLMVGRIMDPQLHKRLASHPRIELAGPQQPEQLPAWVRRMDVGLIPFVHNEFTRFIYPLKINEYLAAGLPVVSTRFGDLSDFTRIVDTGDTPEEFLAASQKARAEDTSERRIARSSFASRQDWNARALQLLDWLSEHAGQV